MPAYKISQDGVQMLRKRFLIRLSIVLLIAGAAAWVVFASPYTQFFRQDGSWTLAWPVFFIALAFGQIMNARERYASRKSLVVTFDGERLHREMSEHDDFEIPVSDLRSVVKMDDGTIIVRGKGDWDVIRIPPYLENRHQLEADLIWLQPAGADVRQPVLERIAPFLDITLFVFFMAARFAFTNGLILFFMAGYVIAGGLRIYYLNKSKEVSHRDRKSSLAIGFALLFFGYQDIVRILDL